MATSSSPAGIALAHAMSWHNGGMPTQAIPCLPTMHAPIILTCHATRANPIAGSTLLAIVVGILLVVAVHPGRGAPFDHIASGGGDCRQAHTKEVQQAGECKGWLGDRLASWAMQCVGRRVSRAWNGMAWHGMA